MAARAFWQEKTLQEMTTEEWESLCDGCGKCCLHKLEDEDTGELFFTRVACRLLDTESCRCTDYAHRQQQVPDCTVLRVEDIAEFHWLPETCAYRLLSENRPLPVWHPLLSGDPHSVYTAGVSASGRVFSEEHFHPDELDEGLKEEIVQWVI